MFPTAYVALTVLVFMVLLFSVTDAGAQPTPRPVDENVFLKKYCDLSPPQERHLDDQWVSKPAQPYPFPQATIGDDNGVRSIFIEGKPVSGWISSSSELMFTGAPLERQLREQGVRLFVVDVSVREELNHAPAGTFETFSKQADKLLAAVPDAYIIVRVWMKNVAQDYVAQHPDALLQSPDGKTDWGGTYASSITSRPNMLNGWRRYCGEHLSKFVHRLGKSPYASHIVGFDIAAMNTGEWWYYAGKGDPGWDYSPSRKTLFEYFVAQKYGADSQLIAKTWGLPNDQHLLDLPSFDERTRQGTQPLTRAADYMQTLNFPITNAAIYFAKIIKTATGGHALTGMEIHAGLLTYPISGTCLLTQLLDCPDIDFLGGPASYENRGAGDSPLYRTTLASINRHGKMWLNEGDYRTHMAYGTALGARGEPPIDPVTNRSIFEREWARGFINGYGTFLMDFGWDWFYEPSIIQSIGSIGIADQFVRHIGIQRKNEIAVVSDQESQFFGENYRNPTRMLSSTLDRIGASYDYFELRDFLAQDTYKNYRMVIFLNICALSDAERTDIEKIKSDGRVVLWMHRPGVVDLTSQGSDTDARLKALTGLQLKSKTPPNSSISLLQDKLDLLTKTKTTPVAGDHMFSDDIAARLNSSIGVFSSDISCTDPQAIPLGVDHAKQVYFAARQFPEWTSVFTSTSVLEPALIRQLLKLAGCHIYVDTDDIVSASGQFISIHAASDGIKEITLPKQTDVWDVGMQKTLVLGASKLSIPMHTGETRIFYLGDIAHAKEVLDIVRRDWRQQREDFRKACPAPYVPKEIFQKHAPASPEKNGPFNLQGVCPAAVLIAGPFPADQTQQLDALASKIDVTKESWPCAPVILSSNKTQTISSRSDQYLYVSTPLPDRNAADGLGAWYPIKWSAAWMSDYRVTMGRGQSYVGAFMLQTKGKDDVAANLVFASQGESRIWIDGKELLSEGGPLYTTSLTLSSKPRLVVFRIQGSPGMTGFTAKILAPDSPRTGPPKAVPDVVTWVPRSWNPSQKTDSAPTTKPASP